MNAKILVEFTIKNACERECFGSGTPHKTFGDLVRWLIQEEGLTGVVEDSPSVTVISVEEI